MTVGMSAGGTWLFLSVPGAALETRPERKSIRADCRIRRDRHESSPPNFAAFDGAKQPGLTHPNPPGCTSSCPDRCLEPRCPSVRSSTFPKVSDHRQIAARGAGHPIITIPRSEESPYPPRPDRILL